MLSKHQLHSYKHSGHSMQNVICKLLHIHCFLCSSFYYCITDHLINLLKQKNFFFITDIPAKSPDLHFKPEQITIQLLILFMNNKVGVLLIKFTPLCLLYISITSGHPIHIHWNGCSTLSCGCSQQQDADGLKKMKTINLWGYVQYAQDLKIKIKDEVMP